MLTVTQLAKTCDISRTAVLYYERAGLLYPKTRSENGYRWYGNKEVKKLHSILAYRSFGLSVEDIATLLDRDKHVTQEQILLDQFNSLEKEIQKLRLQQKAIVMLLEQPNLLEQNMVNKERWTEIMKAAGLDDEAMKNWHIQFEAMEPEAHQEFLESLSISKDEIKAIRQWSKN
ncbi:MerR family transcriptional regulator [Thalassotalea sp. G20_0]|uniref:MerR family transcriptional regulator n=1 Tax=Thalassotalea sp. G20_0 TaxID=2821093 RepID=UPI001ADBECE6|nr:MerR family transcriptional regulator [Thalassotalea sp. G20_0]MBO9497103.1 MerR family transcriptional regulator [Thalassotalea sp. G20_0]